MFQQDLQPVGDSLSLSALCGAIPLAHPVRAARRPAPQGVAGRADLARRSRWSSRSCCSGCRSTRRCSSGTEGAAFGFFPILWIVINAIWVYNLTVASGHFDVLRRSFEKVSPDQRMQAIIIAFCFGALLEALAGFGTPVAITVVMLMALGLPAAQGRRGRADREHRSGGVRRAGHPDRHAGDGHLRRERRPRAHRGHAGRHGRPADPDPGRRRAAGAGLRRRRSARRAPDLAARASSAASRSASRSSSPPTTSRCRSPTSSPRWSRPPRRGAAAGLDAGRGAGRGRRHDVAGRRRRPVRRPVPVPAPAAAGHDALRSGTAAPTSSGPTRRTP